MEVLFGVQRQSPGGGLGAKPPAAERFFLFQRVIVALKRGGEATTSGRIRGRRPRSGPLPPFFKGEGLASCYFVRVCHDISIGSLAPL